MTTSELQLLNLDILKAIRETVDWLVEKYKDITDANVKSKLNEVANQISTLVANKTAYLSVLKKGLSSNEVYIDVDDIKSALQTAETDTEKLNALIRELNSKEVTFSLKHSLEKLASLKQIKVAELKELIAKDALDIADQGKVIHELEEFEQKWIDLGKDIDILFKDAKK